MLQTGKFVAAHMYGILQMFMFTVSDQNNIHLVAHTCEYGAISCRARVAVRLRKVAADVLGSKRCFWRLETIHHGFQATLLENKNSLLPRPCL
jgi:hypothetical protein